MCCGPDARAGYPVGISRLRDLAAEQLSSLSIRQRRRLRKAVAIWASFPDDFGATALADAEPGRFNFTPDRLAHALYNAMHVSDKYVWLWNGANCWWRPGVSDFIARAQDGKIHELPVTFFDAVNLVPGHGRAVGPVTVTWEELLESYDPVLTLDHLWWFIASPDNCEPRNRDDLANWTGLRIPRFPAESELGWQAVTLGRREAAAAADGARGVSYYRLRIQVPESLRGRSLRLAVGGVHGVARVFCTVPGVTPSRLVGQSVGPNAFSVDVKGSVVPGREAIVTIEVTHWGGVGRMFGPVALVSPRGEPVAPEVPERSLLLHLPFDLIREGATPDALPFDHRAKVYGARLVKGRFGRALSFDGQWDRVEVPDSPVFDLPGGAVTWALWFRQDEQIEHAMHQGPGRQGRDPLKSGFAPRPWRGVFQRHSCPLLRISSFSFAVVAIGTRRYIRFTYPLKRLRKEFRIGSQYRHDRLPPPRDGAQEYAKQ